MSCLNYHFKSKSCPSSTTETTLLAQSVLLTKARRHHVSGLPFAYMARDIAWSLAT